MMRDYKFKQSEWPLRTKPRRGRRLLIRGLLVLAVAATVYAILDWLGSRSSNDTPRETQQDPRIVPLQLPPARIGDSPSPAKDP